MLGVRSSSKCRLSDVCIGINRCGEDVRGGFFWIEKSGGGVERQGVVQ